MSANGTLPLSVFSVGVVSVELQTPLGGIVTVQMRSMRGFELRAIEEGQQRPAPPYGDMRRDPVTSRVVRDTRDDDPAYLAELGRFNQKVAILALMRSLVNVEIPGENDEERYASFSNVVETWAQSQLLDHFNRLNGFGLQQMEGAKAELTPFAGASSPSAPVLGGVLETGTPSPSESSESS